VPASRAPEQHADEPAGHAAGERQGHRRILAWPSPCCSARPAEFLNPTRRTGRPAGSGPGWRSSPASRASANQRSGQRCQDDCPPLRRTGRLGAHRRLAASRERPSRARPAAISRAGRA
jgi:hypothetical protein